jgi:hypothetical protein
VANFANFMRSSLEFQDQDANDGTASGPDLEDAPEAGKRVSYRTQESDDNPEMVVFKLIVGKIDDSI